MATVCTEKFSDVWQTREKPCRKCKRRCRHESQLCSACRSGMTEAGRRRKEGLGGHKELWRKSK